MKFDGVVFGYLDENNEIDVDNLEIIVKHCAGLKKVFHMAFDLIADKIAALNQLKQLGFDYVLTKGGHGSAIDNMDTLKQLIRSAKIEVIVGGKVTFENLEII